LLEPFEPQSTEAPKINRIGERKRLIQLLTLLLITELFLV
jgi:hypothetical protein